MNKTKNITYKLQTILLLLFPVSLTFAQPVITAIEGNPQLGETIVVANSNLEWGIEGPAGENVTWDFSEISLLNDNQIMFVSPTSTGLATYFPDANLAYPIGSNSWRMMRVDSSGYYDTGLTSNLVPKPYFNSQQLFFWPATYGDVNTDTYAGSWVENNAYFDVEGFVYSEVDAYGDLILQNDTIKNVLRFKIDEESITEFQANTGSSSLFQEVDTYIWFKAGFHHPLLTLTRRIVGGQGTYINSSFLTYPVVSSTTESHSYESLEVFPNPTTSFTTISIVLEEVKRIKISVINILGQEIMSILDQELTPGEYDYTIDFTPFGSGLYFVKSESGDNINTQRIIVR